MYLVQPEQYLGTNVLKLGRSGKDNLERPHRGYGKKYKSFYTNICKDDKITEYLLKHYFNKKFKLVKGCEYYSGDIEEMKKVYLYVVIEFEKMSFNPILEIENAGSTEKIESIKHIESTEHIKYIESTENIESTEHIESTGFIIIKYILFIFSRSFHNNFNLRIISSISFFFPG